MVDQSPISLSGLQVIINSVAQQDWGWKPDYSLEDMVKEMLENV